MSSRFLITSICLLGLPAAHAADPLACENTLGIRLSEQALQAVPLDDPDAVQLEAGSVDAQMGEQPTVSLGGGIVLRRADKLAGADSAHFDPATRSLYLTGNVRFEDPGTQIRSDSAEFEYDSGRIGFSGAEFWMGSNNSRGAADRLQISQDGLLQLDNVSYTTCPPGSNDWLLQANDIDLDSRNGTGTARGVRLRFQGIPILYAPYLSFPISDARKTGVLTPEVGSTSRSGNEIVVPLYWNIAPNYDATFTPRVLTDRGVQMQGQFRYLTRSHNGIVDADYLDDDKLDGVSRSYIGIDHTSLFRQRLRGEVEFREVSDNQYFEDLGGSLSTSTITHLNRAVRFDLHTDNLSLFGQVQDYQTIDDAIVPEDEPYRRLPQMLARGQWADLWLGTAIRLDGEAVNFDRDVGVTGWRFNVRPELALPMTRPGVFFTPAVALDYTSYDLDNTAPGQAANPDRLLPIASVDTGIVLERLINNSSRKRLQTVEPRLLYVHVPFKDQSDLPVFDTITPDLNLVQLFRKNRFLGVDRIADTDQLSLGLTSRVLDVATGRELMSGTIGQVRYFNTSSVTLPSAPDFTDESSDYIAELRFLLLRNINFDLGHQWGTGNRGTTQSQARLQYRPAEDRIVNLAYRFRRDSLEQGDVSWSWPLSRKWNFVGRYNYSFRDEKVLEEFYGLEYESCCWGLRMVTRRFISTRDGTRDTTYGLQLVLKGMASVGTAADKLLERGILGYSADPR
ncbi:MAG TPA: LPS assembly protein LptD [Woeseiaceae bacterium]|nr:LPS assembly protein LptD [Woeseiaceae bacterium]